MHSKAEAVNVVGLAYGLKSQGHALGVTMLTSGADFGTPGQGIPGSLCPFNAGAAAHNSHSFRQGFHYQLTLAS